MSREAKQVVSEGAKKLRAILRTHYTKDDLTCGLTRMLTDARHLARQRGIDLQRIEQVAAEQASDELVEARQ
jgi:hypothetical protein